MKRYSMEEKAEILKEVEDIGNINLVCKKRGISHTTVHNWIRKGIDSGHLLMLSVILKRPQGSLYKNQRFF